MKKEVYIFDLVKKDKGRDDIPFRVPFNLLKEDEKSVFILKLREIKTDNNYYRYIHHYGLKDNETYIDLQNIDKKIKRYKGNKFILKSLGQSFLDSISKNRYLAVRLI